MTYVKMIVMALLACVLLQHVQAQEAVFVIRDDVQVEPPRAYIGASVGSDVGIGFGLQPYINLHAGFPFSEELYGRVRTHYGFNVGSLGSFDVGTLNFAFDVLYYFDDIRYAANNRSSLYAGGGLTTSSGLSDVLGLALGTQAIVGYESMINDDLSWFGEGNVGFRIPVIFDGDFNFDLHFSARVGVNYRF